MKKLIFILTIVLSVTTLSAQDTTSVASAPVPEKQKKSDKIYYGGNIGLSFGSYTMIAIRPLVGYKLTPQLSGGAKLSYEYIKDTRYTSTHNASNYGGSLFARYRVVQPVYLHAEYAAMNYQLYNTLGDSNREWVPFLLLGGGYSQQIGSNTWVNAQILFDVLQNSNSPYRSGEPFYSIGVGVGF